MFVYFVLNLVILLMLYILKLENTVIPLMVTHSHLDIRYLCLFACLVFVPLYNKYWPLGLDRSVCYRRMFGNNLELRASSSSHLQILTKMSPDFLECPLTDTITIALKSFLLRILVFPFSRRRFVSTLLIRYIVIISSYT